MKKIFLLWFFGVMALGVRAQVPYDTVTVVDPQNFTLATTIDTALVQVISRKANANRRINFQTIKNYSTPDITLSWLGIDIEDTTGTSATYRDFFVTDNEGEVWFVDNAGSARKLYDPAQFQAVTISNDTLYISDGNFAIIPGSSASAIDSISFYGDTLRIYEGGSATPFEVEIISGGGVTGTGDAGTVTYWDTDTTLAFTAVTYSATELLAPTLTGAFGLPTGTTAQRPAGVAGKMRFDSDLSDLQFYNGSAWRSLAESSANAFTAGQFIIANPAGILSDTTTAGALSMMGGTSGSGTAGRVAYWSGVSTLTGHANLLWDGTELSVGTTNSVYTLDMGSGGFRIGGQSAAPTGAAGVVYYDTDDNRTYYHNGTAFAPFVTGTGANTRVAYYSAAGNVTSSANLTYSTNVILAAGNFEVATGFGIQAGSSTNSITLNSSNPRQVFRSGNAATDYASFQPNGVEVARIGGMTNSYIRSGNGYAGLTQLQDVWVSGGWGVLTGGGGTNGGSLYLTGQYTSGSNNSGGVVIQPGKNFWDTTPTLGTEGIVQIKLYSVENTGADAVEYSMMEFSGRSKRHTVALKNRYSTTTGTQVLTMESDTIKYRIENIGAISTTTDASGDVTVTHGMGTTPTAVLVTPTGTTAWGVSVHTIGGTTFKVRFYDLTTGLAVAVSTAVTGTWLAKT